MGIIAKETFLARAVLISLCVGITGLMWDAWWHVAVGRDTFWEPPHLMLYAAVTIAVCFSVYGWYLTREKIWRNLAIASAIVSLSAPFDDAWHHWFGVENLSSIWIVWSPPHLLLFGTLIIGILLALPLPKRNPEPVHLLLGSYAWGCILAISAVTVAPLYPFGPYHILGFTGAGVHAFLLVLILLFARRWNGMLGATFASMVFISLYFLHAATAPAWWVKIPSFTNPPPFTIFFSMIAPALIVDLKQTSWLVTGVLAGFAYGILLYGFTSVFLSSEFQYTNQEMAIAIVSSIIGGLVAGILVHISEKFMARYGLNLASKSAIIRI
jgi:hypothetical protein